ncbi:MAG: type II toxin-antitoxin system VapC family toxin [Candidatus Omnitrophica bacterium]|nr:type II toxin-antitoxin system VapC family toxin [Candidatus Omnitrophota bacterium]
MIAVVDASVVLKWFLQETDSPHALKLRQRHLAGDVLLAAPDLLLYEVGNALRFKRDFTLSDTQAALSDILRFQLELIAPTEVLLHQAADLSHRSRLTYYDSCYLAAAKNLGATLITADERLHQAAHHLATIKLLSHAV